MGNNPSKAQNIKEKVEDIYNEVLSPKNIERTIQGRYCNQLKFVLRDEVLEKYSKDVLGDNAKNIMLGIDMPSIDKGQLCDRMAQFYMKKINLIGTIINSIRLAHLKLDRIQNGGLCYGENRSRPTNISVAIPVEPTLPFKIENNVEPILLDEHHLQNRKDVLKKAGLEDTNLLNTLALIEIDNEEDCKRNGGKWLSTREEAERVYLIPSPDLKRENKKWFETLVKLETKTYENIGKLVYTLDLLVEERVEPKMINGKEERVKNYRDRMIYDKDLDSLILKTKKQILDLFLDLDSYFLILFSIEPIGSEHIEEVKNLETRLKSLKNRGK